MVSKADKKHPRKMPITIRQATVDDLQAIQNTNLHNLPENYTYKYFLYHILAWPQASFVATTTNIEDDRAEASVSTDELDTRYEDERFVESRDDPAYSNPREKVVGYILGKMEDDPEAEDKTPHGHVTSISVIRSYRRLGIAEKLMRQALFSLCEVYGAQYVSLHVRESNRAARHLYQHTLQFELLSIEKAYYADKEDAYYMKKILKVDELIPYKFQHAELVDDLTTDLVSEDEEDEIHEVTQLISSVKV